MIGHIFSYKVSRCVPFTIDHFPLPLYQSYGIDHTPSSIYSCYTNRHFVRSKEEKMAAELSEHLSMVCESEGRRRKAEQMAVKRVNDMLVSSL